MRHYTYERLDGSVRAEERFAAIRSFSSQLVKGTIKSQANEDTAFVFLISTRAGGVGLNLVAADTVSFWAIILWICQLFFSLKFYRFVIS